MTKTWLITGTSRGMGRAWAEAALARGDQVVATARHRADVDDLVTRWGDAVLPYTLDVTDRAAVQAAVDAAVERFGRIDVVVNNAGFGHDGVVEVVSEAEARAVMEVDFFGVLWVTQAAVSVMRAQGSGHIVQMSTQGAFFSHAGLGLYHAAKCALEGMSESLARELMDTGVHVTMIEPGAALTEWFTTSMTRSPAADPVYDRSLAQRFGDFDPATMPPAAAIVRAAMTVIDEPAPPWRLLVTDQAYDNVVAVHRSRLAEFERWEKVSRSARVA